MKYEWVALGKIRAAGTKEEFSYVGRRISQFTDPRMGDVLRQLGTFEVGDSLARYIGNVYWFDSDGNIVPVQPDGTVEIDWSKFTDEQKQEMLLELQEV